MPSCGVAVHAEILVSAKSTLRPHVKAESSAIGIVGNVVRVVAEACVCERPHATLWEIGVELKTDIAVLADDRALMRG